MYYNSVLISYNPIINTRFWCQFHLVILIMLALLVMFLGNPLGDSIVIIIIFHFLLNR